MESNFVRCDKCGAITDTMVNFVELVLCEECGNQLTLPALSKDVQVLTLESQVKKLPVWNPLFVAGLSLVLPGLGHIYSGHNFQGLAWVAGYYGLNLITWAQVLDPLAIVLLYVFLIAACCTTAAALPPKQVDTSN